MKANLLLFSCLLAASVSSQTPLLNSNPAATSKVIYLDFDGQKVSGTAWNNGNTINAAPSTISSANKIAIWKRVSEDYRPFDVNVTTDSVKFNNALSMRRIRVVITPTSAWYGSAGGVAYLGSFTWGGTPGTPCWVFENQLGYNAKNMAEAAAHEVGHTLSLKHQSTYNSTCSKTNEYHPGLGSGVTSWAPIMGVGYSRNVTIWHNGPNATSCTSIQNDHGSGNPGITGPAYLSFLPDDIGNTAASAKIINLNNILTADSGIITQPGDIDAFRFTICSNRYVSFSVKPFALDTVNYSGANLDVRLHVFDSAGNLIAGDSTLTRLHAISGLSLTPGNYYFTVDGGGSANYSDYGSLGKYFVSIKATNPPVMANTLTANSYCAGQNTTLSANSSGGPTSWQWMLSHSSGTTVSTMQNPVVTLASGINTITLITSNASATSCPYTTTVSVGPAPVLNVTGAQGTVCAGKATNLTASGALSYTWMPGGSTSSVIAVSPTVNTTYTVTGANSSCRTSSMVTLNVSPPFSVAVAASGTMICSGETLTLTASGASSYTFQPGMLTGSTITVSPKANTNYLVFGSIGACTESDAVYITVVPDLTVTASVSADFVCRGDAVVITAAGGTTYTVEPGGFTGQSVTVTPLSTTVFTVTGASGTCTDNEEVIVSVAPCDVGLAENGIGKPLIFPVPADGYFTVQLPQSAETVELLSVTGQVLNSYDARNLNEVKIDSSNFAAGLYLVKVSYDSAGTGYSRVLIERK